MIIKFDNYTFDYHIYSLAKSKAVLDDLISKGIDCIYYNDRIAQLYPIDTFFELTEREQKLLDECESYDVFEIDSSGNANLTNDDTSNVANAILGLSVLGGAAAGTGVAIKKIKNRKNKN